MLAYATSQPQACKERKAPLHLVAASELTVPSFQWGVDFIVKAMHLFAFT